METINKLYQQGLEYHRVGDLEMAQSIYEQIISAEYSHAGAHHFLGVIFLARKDFTRALVSIRYALSLCDTQAVYFNNYGVALKETGELTEALAAFEKAVLLKDDYADAWSNLGATWIALGKEQDGENALLSALRQQPQHQDALHHLSNLYQKQQRNAEAVVSLKRLAEIHPNADYHHQIIKLLATEGRHEEAYQWAKAVSLDETVPETVHFLGTQLGECGRFDKAKQYFIRAASLAQDKAVWKWKHLWYCPPYFDNTNQIDEYWDKLNSNLDAAIAEENTYDWRALPYDGFTSSFHLPHHNRCCRKVKEKFTTIFEKSFPFQRPELRLGQRANGKIRVGFLVTPGHEGGFVRMMRGVIERLHPQRFEIFIFSHVDFSRRLHHIITKDHIHHVNYHWGFEQAVQVIRDVACDVLYHWKVAADLWSTFLPMTFLAPIQCTAWGTHGTGGMSHVDYSLTWDAAEIPDAQKHYTETLVRFQTPPNFEMDEKRPLSVSRSELGLPEKHALYFCPHRLSKYHPDFDFYLRDILDRDPNGSILLLMGNLSETAEKIKNRMRKNLGDLLFSRMIFLPLQTVSFYYRYMSVATMVLDSPIYSGELTCYDAFSSGVPCVTQTGDLLMQRYSTAHYQKMGIIGPAVTNQEDYVLQAVKLATNDDYRQEICRQIQERRSLLMEDETVVSEYENFFEKVVKSGF